MYTPGGEKKPTVLPRGESCELEIEQPGTDQVLSRLNLRPTARDEIHICHLEESYYYQLLRGHNIKPTPNGLSI